MRVETEIVDGEEKIWFPAVEYENAKTNERTKYPPRRDPYRIIIHDDWEYHELSKSGLIYDARHRGKCKLLDRRSVK